MTLTTVGYDLNPKTMLGKLVGQGLSLIILMTTIILNDKFLSWSDNDYFDFDTGQADRVA